MMGQLSQEINEAIRLFKVNQCAESRQVLQDYLVNKSNAFDALLWLAKVSGNPQEAMDAAELACFLKPENEIAQRAIAAISHQIPEDDNRIIELNLLKLTGMTETQARAVIWPFKGLNRPIGILLDEKAIELRDITWASENAHDPILQKAARALLLSSIFKNRLKESPQPVKVIEGRENAEYQERIASLKAGILSATVVVAYLFSLALYIANKIFAFTADATISTIFLVVLIGGLFLIKPLSQVGDDLDNYKVGRQGERKVVDFLRVSLKTPWVLFHNLEFPNRRWGDADIVLVGPGGIWCLEVKTYSSKTRNIGDKWQYQSRFGWRNMSKNPTKQVQRTAMRVKEYLEINDMRIRWVQPVIVWVGDESKLTLEDPLVPIWIYSDIENKIEDLWRQQRLTEEQVAQASKILDNAIEKVKSSHK